MLRDPSVKYSPFPQVPLAERRWPTRTITAAPRWLSTDLRDGNQAIVDPMDAHKKGRFFDLLVEIGVKEIEVGFPSAGATEFDFISGLVRDGRVPDDVLVQVLTQSREDLIRTSFASLAGAKQAIVHLYNAVSPAWREVVFGMSKEQVRDIAVHGAKIMRDEAARQPDTAWHFQYSPETFSTAELDFSLEVCEAVMEVLAPTPEHPIILNLPATVEAATPNIYADQVEYFIRNLPARDSAVISLHTHNDRGTGVAAAELALMAGADRVEGCLFGNGERTGNCCLVTMALNMYTQGVDPQLDFSDIDRVIETVEYCNELPVHQRHPYGGELVYTAFSGSHQDAIKKGNVLRSKEVATAASVLVGAVWLKLAGPWLLDTVETSAESSWRFDRAAITHFQPGQMMQDLVIAIVPPLLTLGLLVVLATMAAQLALGGGYWVIGNLKPKPSKLNPLTSCFADIPIGVNHARNSFAGYTRFLRNVIKGDGFAK